MPSNIARFGYVSADRNGRGTFWARISDQASSRKRTRPGSWTAVIGSSPCSVGPVEREPAVGLERGPDLLRPFRDLVRRHADAHERLGIDVVARWAGL